MSNFKLPDTPSFLAMILVVSIVALVFFLAILGKSDTDTFKILVGGLMTVGFTNIVGFYFGSSSSSKAKDETISAMVSGTGSGMPAAVTAAAERAAPAAAMKAAPAAAEKAAPAAALKAAPPAADVAAPPAAKEAVEEEFAKRDAEHKS